MRTEKPAGMSDRERELWGRCVAAVLAEEEARREQTALRERAEMAALLARAHAIMAKARKVPPAPLDRGGLGATLVRGLAWLAANVEAGRHVSVDRLARVNFEAALLDHERARPQTADIGWWHALSGHDMGLDDPEGLCTCGAAVGGFLSLAEIHRRARQKYDATRGTGSVSTSRWQEPL